MILAIANVPVKGKQEIPGCAPGISLVHNRGFTGTEIGENSRCAAAAEGA
jgi:hypothetical protein